MACGVQSTLSRWLRVRDGEAAACLQCHLQSHEHSLSHCTGSLPATRPRLLVEDQVPLTTEIDDILTLVSLTRRLSVLLKSGNLAVFAMVVCIVQTLDQMHTMIQGLNYTKFLSSLLPDDLRVSVPKSTKLETLPETPQKQLTALRRPRGRFGKSRKDLRQRSEYR